MRIRSALVALVLAVPLLGVLGPPARAVGAEPAAGSYLMAVYDGRGRTSQRLVLVGPAGVTTVLERRVSRRYAGFTLADWSTDGRTALLTGSDAEGSWVDRVDVTTGAVIQRQRVRRLATAVLDPAGTGLLATTWESRRSSRLRLDRIAWSGARTRLPVGTNGTLLPGPDGTLLTGSPRGREQRLVSLADGSVLGSSTSRSFCAPVRWWDRTRVLETCGSATFDLVVVDPRTGVRQRLTDDHGAGDYGHYDGRLLADRLYVEVSAACSTYLGQREDDGTVSRVRVPGFRGQVFLVATAGDRLVLQRAQDCNSAARHGLSLFDPVTRVETPLVTLARREQVSEVLVLGETRAATY